MAKFKELDLVVAGMAVHAVGVEILTILPAFVHDLVEHMGFTETQAGRIASLENLGMAAATIAMTFLWSRVHWRLGCILGLCAIGLANAVSIVTRTYDVMLAARFISGFGEGMTVVLSYALIGLTTRKERNFGLLIVSSLLFGAALYWVVPILLRVGGMMAVLGLLALMPLLCLPLAQYFPDMRNVSMTPQEATHEIATRLKFVALFGAGMYALAIGAMWTYFFQIGASAGLAEDVLNKSFSISQLCAIGGGLGATALAHRISLRWALSLGIAGLALPLLQLMGHPSALAFAIIICLFNGFWNFLHPYILSAFAIFGENSRMVIYVAPLIMIGLSAGPAVASAAIGEDGYSRIIVGSAVSLAVSLVCLLPPTFKKSRLQARAL